MSGPCAWPPLSPVRLHRHRPPGSAAGPRRAAAPLPRAQGRGIFPHSIFEFSETQNNRIITSTEQIKVPKGGISPAPPLPPPGCPPPPLPCAASASFDDLFGDPYSGTRTAPDAAHPRSPPPAVVLPKSSIPERGVNVNGAFILRCYSFFQGHPPVGRN